MLVRLEVSCNQRRNLKMIETTVPVSVSPSALEFVRERDLESTLDELGELASEIFEDASHIAAEMHEDPDVEGLRWISFHVEVCWNDAERVRKARDAWYDRTAKDYTPALLSDFGLEIDRRPK